MSKYKKMEIRKIIVSDIELYGYELNKFIDYLKNIINSNKEFIRLEFNYDYDDMKEINIVGIREETDEEFEKRIAKIKKIEKETKKTKEDKERKEYERLKKKFEAE